MSGKTAKLVIGSKEVELPIHSPTAGPDVIDISQLYAKGDVFTYDPGYTSTASCDSTITFIDGEDAFNDLKNKLSIFHYELPTHFNELGYRLMSKHILKKIFN